MICDGDVKMLSDGESCLWPPLRQRRRSGETAPAREEIALTPTKEGYLCLVVAN